MRVAYADPPYIGQSKKHYGDHSDYAGEVDHEALIGRLVDEFSDGWALSCSSPSLRQLLPLCPEDVRVAAWVKPFHVFKKGVRPAYAWEPVIFRGGRQIAQAPEKGGEQITPRDWVSAPITLRRGLVGAKPEAFCRWLFDLLGVEDGDEFVDLFPGSGSVGEAWRRWCSDLRLPLNVTA
jgi:hypothetical protein